MKALETNNPNLSIYIHIPFCESRCYYCDFCSSVIKDDLVEKYFYYLNLEIELYSEFLKDKIINTLFIGGGTPSSVEAKYIKAVLEKLKTVSSFSKDCEITLEVNPNSIDKSKVHGYLNSGINRFSIGAQSFNDDILKIIGRIHNEDDIFKAVDTLKSFNIINYSLDLMLALPNQKMKDIEYSIKTIEELNPTHLSYYSLILEDSTLLKKLSDEGKLNFPNEDLDREMYHYVINSLRNLGYFQYEISNFSKKGFISRHNLNYWTLKNYLGLGLSSHSNIDTLRFNNFYNFNNYFKAIENKKYPIEYYENLTVKDRVNEFSILGLRLNSGIDISRANEMFNINFSSYYKDEIEKNLNGGLIYIKDNFIKLTDRGRDLSNIVETDFIRL
ncbi:radical SAM family heme chaperone HemW [Anaerosphaera multitolerans]|uniref:Heme chaperone HemW n=2 Tax=Anaerosphaera multitolerans TaxID=2487351 RepID=A0A437S8K5_9FIRM|nr:radical SAM family heme chaperone HemW [Anaerosphaera multitolerans]